MKNKREETRVEHVVVKRCLSSRRCARRDFGDASIAVCCCVMAAFSAAEDDSRLRPLSSPSRGARTPPKTLVKAISNQHNSFILFIGNSQES